MRTWQKFLPTIVLLVFGSASFAQEQASEVDMRIKEAEIRMEEAVRQIAELSASQMASVANVERRLRIDGRPVLGVNVGNDEDGPVEGVDILGVSPGGAAADAGLRAGDVITAINGESFTGESGQVATAKLLEFMAGVEEGDVLDVEYLRNGKIGEVEVKPAAPSGYKFAFRLDSDDFHVPVDPGAPGTFVNEFIWMSGSHGWGDMEIVELSERLGSYFGTATGLLVVKAPGNGDFKLQDGDVIRSIDGREPTSVRHAMRILGSYQSGEALKIEIMRDRRKETLNIEVPDNRQSSVMEMPPETDVHRVVIKRTDDQT
jgi:S1-C subfamily serine protease